MEVFYARSSSDTQQSGLDTQIERAKALGIDDDHIFAELVSGKDAKRPQLQAMLKFVRKGDTVVCTKLDRLGRSVIDLYDIVKKLEKKGVQLKVLDQAVDTSTSHGKAFFGMMAVFAEFERDVIKERQREGLARYHTKLKAEGIKPGRTPLTSKAEIERLLAEGKRPTDIMKELGVSKPTYYRVLSGGNAA